MDRTSTSCHKFTSIQPTHECPCLLSARLRHTPRTPRLDSLLVSAKATTSGALEATLLRLSRRRGVLRLFRRRGVLVSFAADTAARVHSEILHAFLRRRDGYGLRDTCVDTYSVVDWGLASLAHGTADLAALPTYLRDPVRRMPPERADGSCPPPCREEEREEQRRRYKEKRDALRHRAKAAAAAKKDHEKAAHAPHAPVPAGFIDGSLPVDTATSPDRVSRGYKVAPSDQAPPKVVVKLYNAMISGTLCAADLELKKYVLRSQQIEASDKKTRIGEEGELTLVTKEDAFINTVSVSNALITVETQENTMLAAGFWAVQPVPRIEGMYSKGLFRYQHHPKVPDLANATVLVVPDPPGFWYYVCLHAMKRYTMMILNTLKVHHITDIVTGDRLIMEQVINCVGEGCNISTAIVDTLDSTTITQLLAATGLGCFPIRRGMAQYESQVTTN